MNILGNYTNLVNGTGYTIASSASSGVPVISFTNSYTSTCNMTYNETTLLLSEAYRRIYPVIRDSSDIVLATTSTQLTGYTSTSWNIENNGGSLNFYYNGTLEMSLSSAGVLATTSTIGALSKLSNVSLTSLASGNALYYNGSNWVNSANTSSLVGMSDTQTLTS